MANVTFAGNPVTLAGSLPEVGAKAKDFTLIAQDLSEKKLSDFDGKIKVIAIYPSIDTGVCAAQNRKINAQYNELEDVVVLSVSRDLPFAHKRFCSAEGLENVVTLSDYREAQFGQDYGFLINELKLLTRGTVVLDKNNVVKFVEVVPEITTEPDYDKALEVVKSL
jgi:thiol peroxidase